MADNGFVKVWRRLFKHPIWLNSTPEQKCVLIVLMEMANHQPKQWEWRGEIFSVERGQFITSISSIVDECGKGVSEQNVRTALKRFEKLEFLTNESTKSGRLITIENYSKWQDEESRPNKDANRHLTKTSQRPNKDLTPNKNDKNDKNDKKSIYIPDLSDFSEGVQQAIKEWLTYKEERKEPYKETGLKAWISQVRNLTNTYEDKYIIDVIQRSMASQYKGVLWDWLKDKPKKQTKYKEYREEVKATDTLSAEEQAENMRRMRESLGGMFK